MARDAWLTVLHASYTGASGIRSLLGSEESGIQVAKILKLSQRDLADAGVEAAAAERLLSPDQTLLDASRAWLDRDDHRLVTLDDPAYPSLLKTIADPPLGLWVRGPNIELLSAPQLAMVGSRNPTRSGAETAESFAHYLSNRGLTITSGLAIGIDAASHRGGLAGAGGTIAVLGGGIDCVYPENNRRLAEKITENGLLVSEYPPATKPRSFHFPQCNRIIAGLSVGSFVVEAAQRSGSLITAHLASENGREVFAMPGSIHSPLARGCHRLIKDGAKLVEDAADILVELAPMLQLAVMNESSQDIPDYSQIAFTEQKEYEDLLDAMGYEPCNLGDISQKTGLTTAELSSMLLLLELEGLVEALPGGLYFRLPKRST